MIEVLRPGRLDYRAALELQHRLVDERIAEGGAGRDRLVLTEHDPVVTLGRGFRGAPPKIPGVDVIETERGGEATYHGPGQLVGYPIVALDEGHRDLHAFLRAIEEALIDALGAFDLGGSRIEGATGVWVGAPAAKIASVGVAVRRWVTFHGFALNVTTDLNGFRGFDPCGFSSDVMTSMERCLGAAPAMERVEDAIVSALTRRLSR